MRQSFRSTRRMDARCRNASALRFRHSQSLASLQQRFSQAMVRSTIQRFGKTAKPFAASERLTISASTWRMAPASPAWNIEPGLIGFEKNDKLRRKYAMYLNSNGHSWT